MPKVPPIIKVYFDLLLAVFTLPLLLLVASSLESVIGGIRINIQNSYCEIHVISIPVFNLSTTENLIPEFY